MPFRLDFKLDESAFLNHARSQASTQLAYLDGLPDKTFKVSVGDVSYALKYEVDGELVKLFVKKPSGSEYDLVKPILQLNIGALLLPESMSLDGQYRAYNEANAEIPEYRTVGDMELPGGVVQDILAEIHKTGFINLIRQKS